ncbi:Sec-independent protein translocase protein TatB [Neisseriaceae bacterium B1]
MFDLSFTEMLLAGVVALVVLGPERLPKVARTVGEWVGKVQRLAANVKSELAAQADYVEMAKIKAEVESAAQEIREEIKDFEHQLQEETQQISELAKPLDNRPAWEKLPEQRTPADFGIVETEEKITISQQGIQQSSESYVPKLSGIHTPSLRKQATARKRDMRPRHRPTPKLRSRK